MTEPVPLLHAVSAVVTAIALIVGGLVGLSRYRRSLRIKAGELLLEMEKEFREVFETCLELEVATTYDRRFRPVLRRALSQADHVEGDIEVLKALDRCLRFFYLCTILHSDFKIEQSILARSYYWYARLLIDQESRPELAAYLARDYRRLSHWLHEHLPCFARYQETGTWDQSLRDRDWRPEPARKDELASGVEGLAWGPLRNDEAGRALVEALALDLGDHFRQAMGDWMAERPRPYPLEDWRVFHAREAGSGQGVGIFGFYRHPGDAPGRYWLGWLGVAPPMRRRGHGSVMVRIVERMLLARGAGSLWVYTDGEDEVARAFYARTGFEDAGRYRDVGLPQAAADDDSLVLRKELGAG